MKLIELFNRKHEVWPHPYNNERDVALDTMIDGEKYTFRAVNTGDAIERRWDVAFLSHSRKFELTGDHVPIKVLSFVKQGLERLIRDENPKTITFKAVGKRVSVYQSMLKRILPHAKITTTPGDDYFHNGETSFFITL